MKSQLPKHPLLINAINARLFQNIDKVNLFCERYQRQIQSSPDPWDFFHFQMLRAYSISLDENVDSRFEIYKKLQTQFSELKLSDSFLYLYELSGVFIRRRQYHSALEYSLSAEKKSFDTNSFYSTHINSLICQEALGFDISEKISNLRNKIKKIPKETLNQKTFLEFNSLLLRFYFREGLWTQIYNYKGPSIFYFLWLKRLPQMNLKSSNLSFSLNTLQPYARFILNTLQFRRTSEDLHNPPINHWTDRLYLWTWTSLNQPNKVNINSVIQLLEEFPFEKFISSLTSEDQIMLSHCLILLSLFDPSSQKKAFQFINLLGPLNYKGHHYLNQERRFIDDLINLSLHLPMNLKSDLQNILPFFRQFQPLKKSKVREILPGLCLNSFTPIKFNYSKIISHLIYGRLWDPIFKTWISSESLVLSSHFFLNIESNTAAIMNDFMESVFGISYYDELIHYRKVYNVLSRLKSIHKGSFDFSIRRQVIHFQMRKERYQLIKGVSQNEFDKNAWRKILTRTCKARNATELSKVIYEKISSQLELNGFQKRIDLEKSSGLSKAKTIRIINQMIEDGVVLRQNSGKKSLYKLTKAFNFS